MADGDYPQDEDDFDGNIYTGYLRTDLDSQKLKK